MIQTLSPFLSKLSQMAWLTFPPLILFSLLLVFYDINTVLVNNWLSHFSWAGYLGLGISAIISWQFGRSRLVYACLILMFFLVTTQSLPTLLVETKFNFAIIGVLFLLFVQDKGLAPINLAIGLISLGIVWLFGLLVIPQIESITQYFTGQVDNFLYELSPTLRVFARAFEWCLIFIAALTAWIRLFFRTDNTHNALVFSFLIIVVMLLYGDPQFNIVAILYLSGLFCYSVLKDSFTMAFKDELTGIPSRRALMQYVQTLGRKYTVVMSDIDHFKKFNDTYGHDVGDEVLKLVASKLNQVTGGGKTFRFGGEEFIIVFPRKSSSEVMPFVEVVRQTITDYDIALRAKPRPPKPKKSAAKKPAKNKVVKVTASFGIAQRSKEHPDFAGIMKQADIALYAAKKAGRNCVKAAKQ